MVPAITSQKEEQSLLSTLLSLKVEKDDTHDAFLVYVKPATGAFHDLSLDPFLSGQECSFTNHVRGDALVHTINMQLTEKTGDGYEPRTF
jgi:hypothetical protein